MGRFIQQNMMPPTPTALVNGSSDGGAIHPIHSPSTYLKNLKTVKSGYIIANTLKTVLSITGKGRLHALYVCNKAGSSSEKTHRIKLTLDDVVVFDATSGLCAGAYGMSVIGNVQDSTESSFNTLPVYFSRNALVEYAADKTETDGTYINYSYEIY